ncbi:hypothetical protein IAT38_006755 [Cryptococcus sp. DSM 104549]
MSRADSRCTSLPFPLLPSSPPPSSNFCHSFGRSPSPPSPSPPSPSPPSPSSTSDTPSSTSGGSVNAVDPTPDVDEDADELLRLSLATPERLRNRRSLAPFPDRGTCQEAVRHGPRYLASIISDWLARFGAGPVLKVVNEREWLVGTGLVRAEDVRRRVETVPVVHVVEGGEPEHAGAGEGLVEREGQGEGHKQGGEEVEGGAGMGDGVTPVSFFRAAFAFVMLVCACVWVEVSMVCATFPIPVAISAAFSTSETRACLRSAGRCEAGMGRQGARVEDSGAARKGLKGLHGGSDGRIGGYGGVTPPSSSRTVMDYVVWVIAELILTITGIPKTLGYRANSVPSAGRRPASSRHHHPVVVDQPSPTEHEAIPPRSSPAAPSPTEQPPISPPTASPPAGPSSTPQRGAYTGPVAQPHPARPSPRSLLAKYRRDIARATKRPLEDFDNPVVKRAKYEAEQGRRREAEARGRGWNQGGAWGQGHAGMVSGSSGSAGAVASGSSGSAAAGGVWRNGGLGAQVPSKSHADQADVTSAQLAAQREVLDAEFGGAGEDTVGMSYSSIDKSAEGAQAGPSRYPSSASVTVNSLRQGYNWRTAKNPESDHGSSSARVDDTSATTATTTAIANPETATAPSTPAAPSSPRFSGKRKRGLTPDPMEPPQKVPRTLQPRPSRTAAASEEPADKEAPANKSGVLATVTGGSSFDGANRATLAGSASSSSVGDKDECVTLAGSASSFLRDDALTGQAPSNRAEEANCATFTGSASTSEAGVEAGTQCATLTGSASIQSPDGEKEAKVVRAAGPKPTRSTAPATSATSPPRTRSRTRALAATPVSAPTAGAPLAVNVRKRKSRDPDEDQHPEPVERKAKRARALQEAGPNVGRVDAGEESKPANSRAGRGRKGVKVEEEVPALGPVRRSARLAGKALR